MKAMLVAFAVNTIGVFVLWVFMLRDMIFTVRTDDQRIMVFGDPTEWDDLPNEQKGYGWLIKDNLTEIDPLAIIFATIIVSAVLTIYFVVMGMIVGAI